MTAAEAGDTPILEQLLREREEDAELFPPVSGDLDDMPTVEFRPLRNRARRLAGEVRRRLTWQRGLAGGASAVAFLAMALGRWLS